MKNSEFRTPLLQSGAVLVAIVLIISMIPSGDVMGVGTVLGALITGIFKLFLFVIALGIGLAVTIAVLIGVFLAAVALQSPEQAAEIFAATKARLAALVQETVAQKSKTTSCCATAAKPVDTGISQEEYDQMKSKISSLQNANQQLQSDVSALTSKNVKLQDDIHGLTTMVDELKESEGQIKSFIDELSAKVKEEPNAELQAKIKTLEEMVSKTASSIQDIAGRLEALEEAATEPSSDTQSAGIFSYFTNEEQSAHFTAKVQEGVGKDLTYAQFDEFLTSALPEDVDKIIKDHPSLTKDYIRSMRK